MGEAVVNVRASVITVGLTLGGTVEAFENFAWRRESLATSLRTTLGCHEPACLLTLTFSAGSVVVDAVLTILDASVTTIQQTAATLTAMPPASISSALAEAGAQDVTVEQATPPTVEIDAVTVPLVVAPPPPSPSIGAGDDGGGSMTGIIAGAGAVVVCLILLVYGLIRRKKMNRASVHPGAPEDQRAEKEAAKAAKAEAAAKKKAEAEEAKRTAAEAKRAAAEAKAAKKKGSGVEMVSSSDPGPTPTNLYPTQTAGMMPRFDPNTGQPIVPAEPPQPMFDPNTGQPIVPAEPPVPQPPPPASDDTMAKLTELKEMLDSGILTEEEFVKEKALVLGGPPPNEPGA